MRYLPTSKLTPGMALGQDIYDGEGFSRKNIFPILNF